MPRRRLALGLVGLLCASASLVGAQERVRLDGVAALVGGDTPGPGVAVILRSDVELRARLEMMGQTDRAIDAPMPQSLLAAVLDEIIGEELITREADRLRAAEPAEADIARERDRLIAGAGGQGRVDGLLHALDASATELTTIARRRAYVAAFLHANLEGGSAVSDAQVERAYEAGNHPFVGQPLPDVREALRTWIAQRAVQRDVRRWVQVLRNRSTVRVWAAWRRSE